MAKDFTDFILMILDSGERVYHLVHLRHRRGMTMDGRPYPFHGFNYILKLDRAYRISWTPWQKWRWEKPYYRNLDWTLTELFRAKKVGLLIYQEPCKKDCARCKSDKDPRYLNIYPDCPTTVDPMHISRIHQPTGKMKR